MNCKWLNSARSQAQIEATGVNTIRIGHEQLEENNREVYENRAVLRKAAH